MKENRKKIRESKKIRKRDSKEDREAPKKKKIKEKEIKNWSR